ncbi:hypothetical protein Tco_0369879 [Tanacetum coccineum]
MEKPQASWVYIASCSTVTVLARRVRTSHSADVRRARKATLSSYQQPSYQSPLRRLERISKKRTKNEAKTTKPDTEWKSMEKT